MIAESYKPLVGMNVMAPPCYLGIDQNTPLGKMVDTAFNLQYTTGEGIQPLAINISTWAPWFLTGIYFFGPNATVRVKPYDGNGEEIFTDFFLLDSESTEPFPITPPYPFQPNDLLRFDSLDAAGAGGTDVEIIFRGFTLDVHGA